MNWVAQNWIWIAVALGAVLLFARRGHHGFGAPRGGYGGGHDHGAAGGTGASGGSERTGAAIDPVSGKPLATRDAVTAFYRGSVYYFENEENRRRFEAGPENFALDQGVGAPASTPHRSHRRHGC